MHKLGLVLAGALLSVGAPPSSRAQTTIPITTVRRVDREQPGAPKKTTSDPPSENQARDLDGFIEELNTLSNTLDNWDDEDHNPSKEELAKLRGSLPKNWTIQTDDGSFVVSSAPLDEALQTGKTEDAGAWVDHALSEAQSYARPQGSRDGNARQALDKILGASEFSAVHPPNAWDLFRQRVSAWVARMLYKLFGEMERYPIAGEILFWGILLLAVSFLARWLFLVSRDRMEGLTQQEIVAANRTWQEWIRLAREAAARQDFRRALHSAYWAGIARLEDLAVVPKDRAKTPREYLRVVSKVSQHELAARPVTYSEPLKELTTRLELVWYANRRAEASDFEDALKQLRALGCQLE